MTRAPALAEEFLPPDEIVQAGLDGDLVLFVGAGASMLLGLPSWSRLAELVLEDLRQAGYIDYSELQQLRRLDPKKQLSVAELIAEDRQYDLNISRHLSGKTEGDSIYKSLNDIGCSCVTTNYDELLSPRYIDNKDGSVTPSPVNRVSAPDEFFAHLLNEPGTVIHLHGSVSNPETMVVTTRDYLEHYDHENVKEFLGELFERKVVLFLGYSLEEAEILEHILRRGRVKQTAERRRFALQGFFRSEAPLYENLYRYYQSSFGVHLLGFLRDKENYRGLERIVRAWSSTLRIQKPPLAGDLDFMNEVLNNA